MIGCHDGYVVNEASIKFCEDIKANDGCNNEMTAADAWKECPKTCGCGQLN